MNIDGYTDFERVGSGGNAHVYRATTIDSGEVVAIKVLHGGGDEAVARRFERERTLMSQLDSIANVVPVRESGFLESGDPYLVMPLYNGGSMEDQLVTGRMPWRKAVELTKKVADSIALAHAKRILHLDIKPANVLLDDTSEPWLADFGIAETMGPTVSMSAKMMTPAYTPPERISGGKPGEQTDTYGIVATLFALLAGRQPYVTERTTSAMAVAQAVQTQPLPIEWISDDVPDSVRNLLLRGMAKDPSDRPRSAIELVGLLEDVLAGREVEAPKVRPSANHSAETVLEPELLEEQSSNRLKVLAPIAVLLLAVIGGAFLLNNNGDDGQESSVLAAGVEGEPADESSSTEATTTTTIAVPVDPPEASFSWSATVIEEGESIRLLDTSSGDVGSVEWWISDGRNAAGASTTQTFPDPGKYQVEMTATGPGGTDTASIQVEVGAVVEGAEATPRPDNIGCQYITEEDVQWVFSALPALVDTYQIEFADGTRRDIGAQPVPFALAIGELNKIIAIGPGGVATATVSSCEEFGGVAPEEGDPELPTNVRCEFHDFFWTEDPFLTWSETWNWEAGEGTESFTIRVNQDGGTEFVDIAEETTFTTVGTNGMPNSGRAVQAIGVVGETGDREFAVGNCGVMGGTGWEVPPRPEEDDA